VILAYVNTSCLVAIAFASGAAGRLADRLSGFDRLLSSNLLEAELRSALAREGVQDGAGPLLSGMTWVHPDRPLTPEFDRVLAPGYPHPHGVAFLSLDRRQREVAARLGFTV
jgi:hypothetical protein